jgi:transcription antitermination protein NusB
MGSRRVSRELAVQFLYQWDTVVKYRPTVPELLKKFWTLPELDESAKKFAEQLIQGILEHQEAIDTKIKSYSENWDFHRIAVVDRNILRLAIYELLFRDDIPPVVSINEAIDLAKKFSTEDSGRFVNGVLDRVKKDLSRPLRTPVKGEQ